MSNTSTQATRDDRQIAFRVNPAVGERIDLLGRYTGLGRSEFLRLAVAFTDSAVTLDELRRIEVEGGLTDQQAQVRDEATATMADVLAALRPKPLVQGLN